MARGESDVGPRGQRFGPGEGPQLLAQLEATGAEVVGSDGERVGELKSVGDADFLVDRTLRRDVRVPVARIQEVTPDNKIVLDLPAGEVDEVGRKPSGETDPSADFSDSAKTEKGALGLRREGGLS